jgi:hypothetical protein
MRRVVIGRFVRITGIGTIASLTLAVSLTGCGSPSKPSVSVAAATPISPANGAELSYYSQPVTLRASSGAATGQSHVTLAFDLATSDTFTDVVTTTRLTAGADPRIAIGPLASSTDYFWRVRTLSGDDVAAVSKTFKFTVGPTITIRPPSPRTPLDDSFEHKQPKLSVENAVRTGPVGTVMYHFEVAAAPGFSVVVASGDVPEGNAETSFDVPTPLTSGAMFFWRVKATDSPTGVSSEYSQVRHFSTVMPDDGSYPYVFRVHVPDSCSTGFFPRDYDTDAYSANLVVTGDRLRFSLGFDGSLSIDLVRSANRVSGAGEGYFRYETYVSADVARSRGPNDSRPVGSAVMSGTADAKGAVRGTYDGLIDVGNCCYGYTCKSNSIQWSLTPR